MTDYRTKLADVMPDELGQELAHALKTYEHAHRSQEEMFELTQNPAAHRLAYEHKVKASLGVQRALGEVLKHLESKTPPSR